jgi:hypothetical protein
MPNTIVQTVVFGSATSRRQIRSVRVISDGTQETNKIVYTMATDGPAIATKGSINRISCTGKITGTVRIEWKQTTNSPIATLTGYDTELDFSEFGGIKNPGATGATGDIVITTIGLASADEFTLFLDIIQN